MIKNTVLKLDSVVICNSIEMVKDFVDILCQGEDHEDHEGNPEEKDIVKYYRLFIVPFFQINILYLECSINIH